MIQKIILQSPTYYYYQSLPTKCMVWSVWTRLRVRNWKCSSRHGDQPIQMGRQQLLLEPFIGILKSLRKQPFSLSVRCASTPIILNGIALPVGFEFFGSGKIRWGRRSHKIFIILPVSLIIYLLIACLISTST